MRAGHLFSVLCLVPSTLFHGVLSRPIPSLSAETDVHVIEGVSQLHLGEGPRNEPKRLISLRNDEAGEDDLAAPKAVAIAIRETKEGGFEVGMIRIIDQANDPNAVDKGWHFPRGKAKKDEKEKKHSYITAVRELYEETGYEGTPEIHYIADWDRFVGQYKPTNNAQKKNGAVPAPRRLHAHFVLVPADQAPKEGAIDSAKREFQWVAMDKVLVKLEEGKSQPLDMIRIWKKVSERLAKPDFMQTFVGSKYNLEKLEQLKAEELYLLPEGIRLDESQPPSPRHMDAPETPFGRAQDDATSSSQD